MVLGEKPMKQAATLRLAPDPARAAATVGAGVAGRVARAVAATVAGRIA